MDNADKFLCFLGIALCVSFFYPQLLFLCIIYGGFMFIGGLASRHLGAMTIGAVSIIPYINVDYKFLVLIFGLMTIGASLGAAGKTHPRTGAIEKIYIERVVYGEMILLEVFEEENKKFCTIETVSNRGLYTIEDIREYHEHLNKAIDKVEDIMKEDSTIKCIWKI